MRKLVSVGMLITLFVIISCGDNSSTTNYSSISNEPGNFPGLFFISTGLSERDAALSADGNEFYYTLWAGSYGTIVSTKKVNNKWSDSEIESFSKNYSNLEPFISANGKRLFFSSNRPENESDENQDYNIWYVSKTDSGWSNPIILSSQINKDANEFYPSVANNGNLYFTSQYENSIGGEDIWMCEYENGNYSESKNLGPSVNSKTDEFNAFVAPDESYIIYSSWNREDGFGSGDLYISIKDNNKEWMPAINLGENINSSSIDYCPFVSRDGKIFFFTSRKVSEELGQNKFDNYKQLSDLLNSSQNGQNDIYWMKADFIDSLKQAILID